MDHSKEAEQSLHNVSYHRPQHAETFDRMDDVRKAARVFIFAIDDATKGVSAPREKQMSFRAIEDAVMYAIAGLARHEPMFLGEPDEETNAPE